MKYLLIILFLVLATSVSFADELNQERRLYEQRRYLQDDNQRMLMQEQYRAYDAQRRLSEQLRYERFQRELEEQRRRDYFLYGR